MFPKAEIHPVIFDEVYILDEKNQQKKENNIEVIFLFFTFFSP